MSVIPKSNLKRIRDIPLADKNGINNDVNGDQDSDSDRESDFLTTESDDISNSEHISEESDLSNTHFEHGDVVTISQPETLKKMTIRDAFKIFFTNEILDQIVLHTNLYAKRYFDKKIRPQQDSNNIPLDSHCWKPVDRIELESFIELLIQSGVHRKEGIYFAVNIPFEDMDFAINIYFECIDYNVNIYFDANSTVHGSIRCKCGKGISLSNNHEKLQVSNYYKHLSSLGCGYIKQI
ncbi:unnamed protein product [Rotaria magnacalcarata]|uniref:PiggyBac transposable element-derived protein domain-containing protein n=1 Tax=Rotaria magnacalcarata TaxID=392030 RepID=A0A815J102_9BILA|nr:unnamed protein product [Rotaria magnacalcarata]CAF1372864.1 unnamed protein product [Rotaria magnacalcarata]